MNSTEAHWCWLEFEDPCTGDLIVTSPTFSIGRSPENDLTRSDGRVSSWHCQLILKNKGWSHGTCLLRDSSTHGTYVNGKKVGKGNSQTLLDGDRVALVEGDPTLTFVYKDAQNKGNGAVNRENGGDSSTNHGAEPAGEVRRAGKAPASSVSGTQAAGEEDDLARALRVSLLESEQARAAPPRGSSQGEEAAVKEALRLSMLAQQAAAGRPQQHPGSPPAVFLFVSRTSGGNLGQRYLDLRPEGGSPAVPLGALATAWVYDIAEEAAKAGGGFEKAVEHGRRQEGTVGAQKVLVIACGGDGTVSWMVSELRRRAGGGGTGVGAAPREWGGVGGRGGGEAGGGGELDALAIGVLPLGTGNDFSRTFGWGGKPPVELSESEVGFLGLGGGLPEGEITRMALGRSVAQWLKAEVVRHDLWTVEVRASEGGDMVFVAEGEEVSASESEGLRRRHRVEVKAGEGMAMRKPLLNYFSFGYESKVGFEFDKHRTGSAQLNKLVYGIHGLWEAGKAQVGGSHSARVRAVLKEMAVVERLHGGMVERRSVVVTSLDSKQAASHRLPTLASDPLNLLMMNTKTIVKGKDVWGGTREVLQVDANHVAYHHSLAKETVQRTFVRPGGNVGDEAKALRVVEVEPAPGDLGVKEQALGDRKVYFVTYEDIASFVGDIARGELFGGRASHAQRLWYGPQDTLTRPRYLEGGEPPRVAYIELAFKPARQPLSQIAHALLSDDGRPRGALPPRAGSAEGEVAASQAVVTCAEAEQALAGLSAKFPADEEYLGRLRAAVQRAYPAYCNRREAVYMQVDGEYFAVRWPRCVRVEYDAAINVLRNAS